MRSCWSASCIITTLAEFLARNDVPLLNMFVYNPETHGTSIGPDNHKALYRLTRHLIDLGHRRFGVIAQDSATNDRAKARNQGIRDALAEQALAVRPDHFVVGQWTIREGRELFRRIVSHDPKPTAVICGNGYLAVGRDAGKPGTRHPCARRDVDRRV
jgi:LacI family transcriptional regulator